MLEAALYLLMNSLLLMLRIAPGDSFPKPLSREEEQKYLERWSRGDIESRNILVEHNLRLVAHIVRMIYELYIETDSLTLTEAALIKQGIKTKNNNYFTRFSIPCLWPFCHR